jgi:SAM-dependent methyltransferase
LASEDARQSPEDAGRASSDGGPAAGRSPGADEPDIGLFLDEPTRDLSHWAWLWTEDRPFPIRSCRGGLAGRLVTLFKRLFRPFFRLPLADLWDRQRIFNLILIETLHRHRAEAHHVLESHENLLKWLDERTTTGLADVMRHNDALFARVDQKLDRYRLQSRELWSRLGALIATAESEPPSGAAEAPIVAAADALAGVQREQTYVELERRYRGTEEEIFERISVYLPHLEDRGEILDLGCGRGEALELLREHGIAARGIDSSAEMVARCREKGLEVEKADLFGYLKSVAEGSLGGVVSFHVIEHLAADHLDRLVRLAWRALKSGGVLILETPSPLSVVMAARNFWIDPTHQRPVHPASLEVTFREAGFEPVHRLDLHPFPEDERLPEIDVSRLAADQRDLADQVNRLRDLLDDLLFGARDFGMVGVKP